MIAFSQIGTKNTTTDSTKINLPIPVAREVVKDVIRKDKCEEELASANKTISIMQRNDALRDSIISTQKAELSISKQINTNLESQLILKDQQKANLQTSIDVLKNDLKKQRRKTTKTQIIGGVVAGFLVYLILK